MPNTSNLSFDSLKAFTMEELYEAQTNAHNRWVRAMLFDDDDVGACRTALTQLSCEIRRRERTNENKKG